MQLFFGGKLNESFQTVGKLIAFSMTRYLESFLPHYPKGLLYLQLSVLNSVRHGFN